MDEWRPIETAPRDGTRFIGRRTEVVNMGTRRRRQRLGQLRYLKRITWFGKTSHVPLYGWCHGRVENVDLWEPTHWKAAPPVPTPGGE